MKAKEYIKVTSWLFALIFVVHVLRLFNSWEAFIGGFEVPLWWSWIAVAISGYLAYFGIKLSK